MRKQRLCVVTALASLAIALDANSIYTVVTADRERPTSAFSARVLSSERRTYGYALTVRLADGAQAECTSDRDERAGDILRLRGRIAPFDAPRNPGESDMRIVERERGLRWHVEQCTVFGRTRTGSLDPAVLRGLARQKLRATLESGTDPLTAALLTGMLWGERGALPDDVRDEFQETGTVHVLVTAGLHVGILCGALLWLLRSLTVPRGIACALCVVTVFFYAWFSGAHIPALRASLMAAVFLSAHACGRKAFSWEALAAAVLAIVFLDPLQVLDGSFWMSFCCVAAIFALAHPLTGLWEALRAPKLLREALALTCATQAGTWPLTAYIFLRFAPYAIAANAIIVPAMPMVIALGAAHMLLSATSLSPFTAVVLETATMLMRYILDFFDMLPFRSIATGAPPLWAIALYEAALLATAALRAHPLKNAAAAVLIAAAACCFVPPQLPDGHLRVVVFDVGQADSILVITPSRRAILVDAGGRIERGPTGRSDAEDIGTRIVVPALLHLGVTHIDACLLTHPHGDHAGGYVPVIETLGCDVFADSGQQYGGHAFHADLAALAAHHTALIYPKAGTIWRTDDGVELMYFGPQHSPIRDSPNDVNNNSLIVRVRYGAFCALLTGDAGVEAEARALAMHSDLHCAVLKVGHHGSAYSSSPGFLNAVSPQVAIISDGRHNTFGHPALSTLERLHASGAMIFRTDHNGAVIINTDDRGRYSVETMIP